MSTPLAHHTLEVDGTRRTLADWGVRGAVLTEGLGGVASLVLTVPRDLDDEFLFALGETGTLRDAAGAIRFVGPLEELPIVGGAGAEVHTYVFRGPNVWLDEITFERDVKFAVNPSGVDATVQPFPSSALVLNWQTGATVAAQRLSIRGQVTEALEWAVTTKGVGITYDVAALSDVLFPPQAQVIDATCLDVLKMQCERWQPTHSWRWVWGATPSALFVDTTGGAPYEIDVTAGGIGDWRAVLRGDLLVKSFTVRWEYEQVVEADGRRVRYISQQSETATAANSSRKNLVATLRLRGGQWSGDSYTAPEEPPPAGLADAMLRAYGSEAWECSWWTVAREVDYTRAPGDRVVFANAGPATGKTAAIQQIVRDVATGRVSYQAGPPVHLGLDSLLALRKAAIIRKEPVTDQTNQYGFEKPEANSDRKTTPTTLIAEEETAGAGGTYTVRTISLQVETVGTPVAI